MITFLFSFLPSHISLLAQTHRSQFTLILEIFHMHSLILQVLKTRTEREKRWNLRGTYEALEGKKYFKIKETRLWYFTHEL